MAQQPLAPLFRDSVTDGVADLALLYNKAEKSWLMHRDTLDLAQESKRYNVLLLLVDDLRPTLGVYGDTVAQTPEIDAWATQAHVFERAYTNQAVCVASRYNLLLGARSTSTGLYDFGRSFRQFYPDAVTLPEYFKNNGYHTEAIGKVFHVGHNTYNDEQSWSVPHYADLLVEYADKTNKGTTREEALFANKSWAEANGLAKGAAWECLDVPDETYADGRVANRAVDRLAQMSQQEKPFFMAVGFARPHLPFSVPQKYWARYDPMEIPLPSYQENPLHAPAFATKRDGEIAQYKGIPWAKDTDPFPDSLTRKLLHGYYAGTSYVDAQIGKVLQQLKTTGLAKNTIVVLWGDHGYLLGEMGMWTKHVNYELANRIPLIIAHPDLPNSYHKSKNFIETVDIFPTLVDLCGLGTVPVQQPMDGKSYKKYLQGLDAMPRQSVYHSFPRAGKLGRAVRNEQYRLIEWRAFNSQEVPIYELYAYDKDLVERENIWHAQHPAFIALKAVLDKEPQALAERPEQKRRNK